MVRTRKWNLKQKLRELESWLRPETTGFKRDQPRRELADLLRTHEPHTLGFIANYLGYIALWENQSGAYAVLRGDESGWSHLRLGLDYSAWKLRTVCAEHEQLLSQSGNPDVGLAHGLAARSLAQAIALRDDKFSDWCGQRMLQDVLNPKSFFQDWTLTPFHPFMARLYACWRGYSIDTENASLRNVGIYQRLWDTWKDDQAYINALLQACDFHTARTAPLDNEFTEFWEPPLQVFPAEILAVQRIRQEQIGTTPVVLHPLLDTPLGRVPMTIPILHDELLTQVIARVTDEKDKGSKR